MQKLALKPYEKVHLVLRKHWLLLFFIYLEAAFLILFGILIFSLSNKFLNLAETSYFNLSIFLLYFYFLIIWQVLFLGLTDYYLDAWIITDHRILDIQQVMLFKRDVSELRLSKIQDVSVKVEGFLPTIFNYGDIIIQTAGIAQEFHFKKVPNPYKVKDLIFHLYDEYTREHSGEIEVHEKSF